MRSALTEGLHGIISILLYLINTMIICIPLFAVAVIKLLLPFQWVQTVCRKILTAIASAWVAVNQLIQKHLNGVHLNVAGLEKLNPGGWFLVIANHQSWVDIIVLQSVFHRKIPFLKFFLKKELFWFPLLGQAWWALDFPFMKRYSRTFLKKHPHLIGKDLEITKRACEKFRHIPVSVMSFVEGTRFTAEKHARQRSPYEHLLRTKAGGMAFALAAMGDKFEQIVDVTIAYPQGAATFWDFLCGRVKEIDVHVDTLPVDENLMGDYLRDAQFKHGFQDWLNALWREKDLRLAAMLAVKVKS
jgi:1-acyl-sn-glycerol-3-phosphate acyltransferase